MGTCAPGSARPLLIESEMRMQKRNTFSIRRTQTVWGYIFILPAILGFALFYLGPMLFSLGISFFDW